LPALLNEPLYQPDGQILDEVYVYGSFRQSRMYAAGVTCGDCHEPHSLALKGDGDAVCAQCHEPAHFTVVEHTGHEAGPEAPGCRDCHMPSRNYMVVDARRDHSFRVPRPDLAASLGVTDACATCHADRPAGWSAEALRERLGRDARGSQNFAVAFRRAAEGWPDSVPDLLALVDDAEQTAIVRATALAHLAAFPSRSAFPRIAAQVYDVDPLVRLGAVYAAEAYPESVRAPMVTPLLVDPVLAVRAEAARLLADVDPASLPPDTRDPLRSALADYVAMQRFNADRPESRLSLGNLYAEAGDAQTAESQFRAALALQPDFAPAWSNLADLQRARGDEAAAEATLRDGLKAGAEPAALEHALGLLMVRDGRQEEALEWLGRAASSAPDNARLGYVYGVALHDLGQPDAAILTLEQVHERRPSDVEVLAALVAYTREVGRSEASAEYAARLAAIAPGHPASRVREAGPGESGR
jgi:predicted CXXCH cytochrome family protein